MRRLAPLVLVWAFLALALGAAAATAAPPVSLPDGPSMSTMALGPSDFARARVAAQGHQDADGAIAAYGREFAAGARVGRTPLLGASSFVTLLATEAEAREQVAAIRAALGLPQARAELAKQFKASFSRSSGGLKITSLTVSRPATLGIGVDSVRFAITFTTRVGRFHIVIALVRVDRALGEIVLLGRPGKIVAAGDVKRLGVAQRERFRKGFTITKGAPLVSGTAAQGATLTAEHQGRWDGGPSAFAYQWSRCDAAGACTPIAGAVGQTYVVTAEDAGKTLKVSVTAKNSVSALTVESPLTTAVP